jgi:hypothetical protein
MSEQGALLADSQPSRLSAETLPVWRIEKGLQMAIAMIPVRKALNLHLQV